MQSGDSSAHLVHNLVQCWGKLVAQAHRRDLLNFASDGVVELGIYDFEFVHLADHGVVLCVQLLDVRIKLGLQLSSQSSLYLFDNLVRCHIFDLGFACKALVATVRFLILPRTGSNFSLIAACILVEVYDLMFSNRSRFDPAVANFFASSLANRPVILHVMAHDAC